MKMPRFSSARKQSIRQAGFALVSAIFLLVILAGLGVAMVRLSTMQHQDSALDVQGVRAYQAARAGIEWGIFQRAANPTICSDAGVTTSFTPVGSTFTGFVVTVTCTTNNALGGVSTQSVVIDSTACNIPTAGGACPRDRTASPPPASADFVQRTVQARL
jgi:MSHA biogenesis protein MshP